MGSFDDTSKIRRVLKKNTPMVLDDSGMQSISAKNRKQPAGIIREMPRTLAPMALRPCLSTSLPKNCPIFLKIDMLILSTLFYHTPPRVSTGFTGILFIFYVVFFSNVAENVYILVLSLFHFLFCKVRKKVAGEPFSGAARRISRGGTVTLSVTPDGVPDSPFCHLR